jgi:tetratricopeptide (TPR) repeat protein
VCWLEARAGDAEAAWQCAVEHAGRAGDEEGRADALVWIASSAFSGPMSVPDGIARCEAIRTELHGNPPAQAFVLQLLAGLRAMRGEFATARDLLAHANQLLSELGTTIFTAPSYYEAFVALLADDPVEAESRLRPGYRWLKESGQSALLADTAVMLARALYGQSRLDEALHLTYEAEKEADTSDLSAQFAWRATRGAILARRGALDQARSLTAEAVALAQKSDWLRDQADALATHADVLIACGDRSAAFDVLEAALALYHRKGSLVDAHVVRAKISSAPYSVR